MGVSVAADDEFASFYAGTFARLVGQLSLVTGDRHEAEDAVQEAFARASTRWSRLRHYDVPEAWVRRVAFNLAVSGIRHRRRGLAALLRLGPPPSVPEVDVADVALSEALTTLPLGQRQALVLHYLVGLPVQEVAVTLGVPLGTVKVRLHRGRRALAALLGEGEVQSRHG
jgi:RNA polymerase sigma-70 factor (ECF subfamily)